MSIENNENLLGRKINVVNPLTNSTVLGEIIGVKNNEIKVLMPLFGDHREICEVPYESGDLDNQHRVSKKCKLRITEKIEFAKRVKEAIELLENSGL